MTEAEARKLTEKIKNNITASANLVRKAHAGKVWIALGYSSFEGWLNGELKLSRSRGYQLLLVASVENELRENLDLPEDFALTDREFKMINDYGVNDFIKDVNDYLEKSVDKVDPFIGVFSVLKTLKEAAAEKVVAKTEIPDPVDDDEIAENFFNAFKHDVSDVLEPELLEARDYERMIEELSETIKNIDGILSDYYKADN